MLRQACKQYVQLSIQFEHQVIDHLLVGQKLIEHCGYNKKPYERFQLFKKVFNPFLSKEGLTGRCSEGQILFFICIASRTNVFSFLKTLNTLSFLENNN